MAVDTSGWQLIATFPDTVQASIAAGMLEDHGIPAIVGPDRMATIYMAGTTWAQIPLHVRPDMRQKRGACSSSTAISDTIKKASKMLPLWKPHLYAAKWS